LQKFATKKNREDIISLRWPLACLGCGDDIPSQLDSRYAIVGMFHVVKQTQVLVKLPGFFYHCEKCDREIDVAVRNSERKSERYRKLIKNLQEAPWNEFIELEKTGIVKLPDGPFKQKLQEANPEARFKTKDCPLKELNRGRSN